MRWILRLAHRSRNHPQPKPTTATLVSSSRANPGFLLLRSALVSTSLLGAARAMSSTTSSSNSNSMLESLYGLPPGPFAVGVATTEFVDEDRADPGDPTAKRALQVEVWYPAKATTNHPLNKFSDFVGLGAIKDDAARAAATAAAEAAFGGYRDGLTIAELDASVWKTGAFREAPPAEDAAKFPLVAFSHGSGAYRASYTFWCEFLASHGYVVAAPDHPGSARFTIAGGKAITPGGPRSERPSMEAERPLDVKLVLDGMQALSSSSTAGGRKEGPLSGLPVDCSRVAVTGMSFGGYTTAAFLELGDPRVAAAVMMCPSIAMSGTKKLATERGNRSTPVMVMLGTEDTVIGETGNEAGRAYADEHSGGDSYLLEVVRGGHVSFTSCGVYDPNYGNGIGETKECPSLTQPGKTYRPLAIAEQHRMINSYGLAFLNAYLKDDEKARAYLEKNHFADSAELVFRKGRKN